MSMSRKELQPLATAIGRVMLDHDVTTLDALPVAVRVFAREVRYIAAVSAANFDGARFDAWTLDVAEGRRDPLTGAVRKPAPVRRAAVSA